MSKPTEKSPHDPEHLDGARPAAEPAKEPAGIHIPDETPPPLLERPVDGDDEFSRKGGAPRPAPGGSGKSGAPEQRSVSADC